MLQRGAMRSLLCHNGVSRLQREENGKCCGRDSHLMLRQREWKLFVVNEFQFCYKENGMESVCCKEISYLLQREWEQNMFDIRKFHICYNERSIHSGLVTV